MGAGPEIPKGGAGGGASESARLKAELLRRNGELGGQGFSMVGWLPLRAVLIRKTGRRVRGRGASQWQAEGLGEGRRLGLQALAGGGHSEGVGREWLAGGVAFRRGF